MIYIDQRGGILLLRLKKFGIMLNEILEYKYVGVI